MNRSNTFHDSRYNLFDVVKEAEKAYKGHEIRNFEPKLKIDFFNEYNIHEDFLKIL